MLNYKYLELHTFGKTVIICLYLKEDLYNCFLSSIKHSTYYFGSRLSFIILISPFILRTCTTSATTPNTLNFFYSYELREKESERGRKGGGRIHIIVGLCFSSINQLYNVIIFLPHSIVGQYPDFYSQNLGGGITRPFTCSFTMALLVSQ